VSVPAESLFGPIVTGDDVEQWCLDTLKEWSGTYLAEVERQSGLDAGDLQRVRSWRHSPSYDKWPEDQLPCVILRSVGTAERPLRKGDGSYDARWLMQLDNVCSARTEDESHRMAMLYAAAHLALVLQRPSLGGHAAGISWVADTYTDQPFDGTRSLAAVSSTLEVQVNDVVRTVAGPTSVEEPLTPDTDPWPPLGTVESHDEQVVKLPLEGGT